MNTHRCHGTKGHSDDTGQYRDQNGVTQQLQQVLILKQSYILLQGEAFKLSQVLASIEGTNNQHQHGNVQKDEY